MGNGPSKQTDRKSDVGGRENNNETSGETQHRSFIVEGYDAYDDEGYNRNRTTSDGWDKSNNDFPVELAEVDLLKHENKDEGISSISPDGEKTVPVVIRWHEPAKSVFVICSYDEWKTKHNLIPESHDERSNSKHDSIYLTILNLPRGEHYYRYIVDGKETINQKEKTAKDDHGRLNNIIRVGKADFEAFDALKMDGETGTEPDSEYGQVEPRAMNAMEMSRSKNQPPLLPTHLLHKILLNQDTSLSCEPSLLPVPNSTQLNHLYALSIKEDTLALSATHRFRGKFVTTLLYKPIEQAPRQMRRSVADRSRARQAE